MKIVIAATPTVALPAIKHLIEAGHEVTIATQPDRPAGRGLNLKSTPVAEIFPEAVKIDSEEQLAQLINGRDLLITIGYGRILNATTLAVPKFGGINLHFSLLPKWRGAAPVQRAIEAGDAVSGVTVFQMDEGMDTGPIWLQKEFAIPYGYTSEELFESLSQLGAEVLVRSIQLITSGSQPHKQEGLSTVAKKIDKRETQIDWQQEVTTILRKIRAFGGNLGLRAKFRGETLKILSGSQSDTKLPPGEINALGEVGCADGAIKLSKVIPAGRRAMSVQDWLNGVKLTPGERFE